MLGETAVDVEREDVKREGVTHHGLRFTELASRAKLAGLPQTL